MRFPRPSAPQLPKRAIAQAAVGVGRAGLTFPRRWRQPATHGREFRVEVVDFGGRGLLSSLGRLHTPGRP